eukprot:m.390176 g.390176  ORF g.390176 m.390176 type:complete len:540 (+) comp28298_c1_seq6:51-1670(+)
MPIATMSWTLVVSAGVCGVLSGLTGPTDARRLGNALKFGRTVEDIRGDCAGSGSGNLGSGCGDAQVLTPLLETNQLAKARDLAEVTSLPVVEGGASKSFSGFFTTDKSVDNNLFWWYFPAQNGDADAPTLVWLQGGPGAASTFGLFAEMGPYVLTPNASSPTGFNLGDRATSWNKKYGMIFIDNPVGAGFSYTGGNGYCHDTHDCVARNLYSALQQFYTMFPTVAANPLWITGESYGGHYVPAIAAYIHNQNERLATGGAPPSNVEHQLVVPETALPLAGIAVGDGWVDPVNMLQAYAPMIYNQAMCSETEAAEIAGFMTQAADLIKQGDFLGSFNVWDKFLNGDIWPYGNWFHNKTGLNDYDNYMNTDEPADLEYYHSYLNVPSVRAALHIGSHTLQSGHDCEMALLADFMASLKTEIMTLMNRPDKYRVLVYSGQLDVIIGAALTESFLTVLPWDGLAAYNSVEKFVWRMDPSDSNVAGYVRVVGNFTQAIIRGAGHLCPHDQPERSLDMITRLVDGLEYKNEPNPVPSNTNRKVDL